MAKSVTIRLCCKEDAADLIETIKTYLADSDCIPLAPDEFNATQEQEEVLIQSFLENENSLLLVAVHAGQIVGNIDLTGNQRRALKHTAMIGMGMRSEWRNQGLGSALMMRAIEWARQNPLLEILWLQVYANNIGGLKLYEHAGFQVTGLQSNFFRMNDTCFDNITMTLRVK